MSTSTTTGLGGSESRPKLHRFVQGYRGFLVKRGKVFRQWHQRYFVLTKNKLRYYQDESCSLLQGEITIGSNVKLFDIPEERDGKSNLFYIMCSAPAVKGSSVAASAACEPMFLSAPNEKEKAEWLEAITDAVHMGFKQVFQPDLWGTDFYPSVDMSVVYPRAGTVDNGNFLRPQLLEDPPEIKFNGVSPDERFTFVMMDADPVGSKNDNYFLHWCVQNFSASDINSGEVLSPYVPPAPAYGSGSHRYFFLLFRQRKGPAQIVMNEFIDLVFQNRDAFAFRTWVKRMNFNAPAAINGFYSSWEDCCDRYHRKMNYLPPEPFRSPHQESSMAREAEMLRLEKHRARLYEDFTLSEVFHAPLRELSHQGLEPLQVTLSFAEDAKPVADYALLSVALTSKIPSVHIDGVRESDLFTLFLCDLDSPSRFTAERIPCFPEETQAQAQAQDTGAAREKGRETVLWCVANIPAGRVAEGETLCPYWPPAPGYSSGLHRCLLIVYAQTAALSAAQASDARTFFLERERARVSSFAWVQSLSECFVAYPVALSLFLSQWEPQSDLLQRERETEKEAMRASRRLASSDDDAVRVARERAFCERFLSPAQFRAKTTGALQVVDEEKERESAPGAKAKAKAKAQVGEEEDEDEPVEIVDEYEFRRRRGDAELTAAERAVRDLLDRFRGLERSHAQRMADLTRSSGEGEGAHWMAAAPGMTRMPVRLPSRDDPLASRGALPEPSQRARERAERLLAVAVPPLDSAFEARDAELIAMLARPLPPPSFREETSCADSAPLVAPRQDDEPKELARERTSSAGYNAESETDSDARLRVVSERRTTPAVPASHDEIDSSIFESEPLGDKAPPKQPAPKLPQPLSQRLSKTHAERKASSTLPPTSPRRSHDRERDREMDVDDNASVDSNAKSFSFFKTIKRTFSSSGGTDKPAPQRSITPDALDSVLRTGPLEHDAALFGLHHNAEEPLTRASPLTTFTPVSLSVDRDVDRDRDSDVASIGSASSSASSKKRFSFGFSSKTSTPSRPLSVGSAAPVPADREREKERGRNLTQTLKNAANTALAKCAVFDVSTSSIFDGESLVKKFSGDLLSKPSTLWVDTATRTLHWAKSAEERGDSKFVVLDAHEKWALSLDQKHNKGVMKSVKENGLSLTVVLESGEQLELKVNPDSTADRRAADWAKVLRTFLY